MKPTADTRSAYRHFQPITTRWMDNDVYGHVNNVIYYSYFDTVVNTYLIREGVLDIGSGDTIGLVIETQCNYFAALSFPDTVVAGLRVARLGNSSVRYEVGLFRNDEDVAAAQAILFMSMWIAPRAARCRYRPRCAMRCRPWCANPRMQAHDPARAKELRTMDSQQKRGAALIDQAIITRRSVRAFLDTPVPRDVVNEILAVASRAPSGTNAQPWRVYVLTGDAKVKLSADVLAAYDDPQRDSKYREEYPYYPREWVAPYIDRRRKVGWDLYSLLQISREDKARMHAQHSRNFTFFGAPVGMIFTIDRILELGSWLDYGMFLQSIMVAARARGLDTCPQAAFTQFHAVIGNHLRLPADEMVVCGMALGHADPAAIENTLSTEREPVSGFARFLS